MTGQSLLKIRLGFVSTYLPQQCGIATYTCYLAGGIRAVAPKVKVKIIAERGALPEKQDAFEVIPCWNRTEKYVEQILPQTTDLDVVHIQHEYGIYSFDDRLPSLLTRIDTGIKKIITIHCVRPSQVSKRGAVDEKYAKRIAELADHVIVHLPSQKAILIRLRIAPEKISVIPHGTELSNQDQSLSRKRLGLPPEGKILLMFGFVKPHKCLHIALEALHLMLKEQKNVWLFVAGGLSPTASKEARDYVEFIQQKIEELKLQEHVIFPNKFYPNEDVPYLFGASDVTLFPYYEEDRSASGSLHLAIGAGKPVIASRIPKFEELGSISDELLVLPYNAASIAKLIIRIFNEQEFSNYVLERAETYRQLTSWPNIAKKHLAAYRGVLS